MRKSNLTSTKPGGDGEYLKENMIYCETTQRELTESVYKLQAEDELELAK